MGAEVVLVGKEVEGEGGGWRERYGEVLGGRKVVVVDMERCLEEGAEEKGREVEEVGGDLSKYGNSPASPVAYILFTSGTTGTPKVFKSFYYFRFCFVHFFFVGNSVIC